MGSILHKRGTGVPSAGSLSVGELAIDQSTGKVYTKTTGGQVVEVGGGGGGGSGVGVKAISQPVVWTNTAGIAYKSQQQTGLANVRQFPQTTPSYMRQDDQVQVNDPTQVLNVPAGLIFHLYGISATINSGTGSVFGGQLYLDSIKLDGETLYPGASEFQKVQIVTSPTDLLVWPQIDASNVPSGKFMSNGAIQKIFSRQPYIIENQLSFKASTYNNEGVDRNTTYLVILGEFFAA